LDTDVLSLIDSQEDSAEQGAVLIFLPGFGEIMQVVLTHASYVDLMSRALCRLLSWTECDEICGQLHDMLMASRAFSQRNKWMIGKG
jgi:hypothetical protein